MCCHSGIILFLHQRTGKKSADELKSFLNQSLLEYHLDRVEILYDTMLEIQGWAVDQRGETEIAALNQDGSPFACRISSCLLYTSFRNRKRRTDFPICQKSFLE